MAEETQNEVENASSPETQDAAPPKKKLPLLILLSGAQVLMTLVVGGVMIMGLKTLNHSSVQYHELTERTIASVKDDSLAVQWVELEPFTTNTASKNSLRANLNVEVKDPRTAELLKARMPAVRSKILNLLSQQDAKSLRRMQDKLLLKEALRETINQELARDGAQPGVIRDVYFVEFMIR